MMNDVELEAWFAASKTLLEDGYTEAEHPWQQSGFGVRSARTADDWDVLRRPIAASMSHSGTWLDIGCANGYLIECVLRWTMERDLQIEPYGLDFSAKLIALAQRSMQVAALGLTVSGVQSGILHGKEMTRAIAVNPT
jgi:hypothetical protein